MRRRAMGGLPVWAFGLVACTSLPAPEFEPFDPTLLPRAEEHPDAPAVVVVDRGAVRFPLDETGRRVARLSRTLRIRKLRELPGPTDALLIPWEPGSGLYGLRVRVSRLARDVTEFLEGVDLPRTRTADGRPARVLSLPDLEPGDVVEVVYDHYFDDPRVLPPWRFQHDVPTRRSEFSVTVPPGVGVDFRFSTDGRFVVRPPERFETPEGTRYAWLETKLPALWPEPDAPSARYRSNHAWVLYDGEAGRMRSWDDAVRWLAEQVDFAAEPPEDWLGRVRVLAEDRPPDVLAVKLAELVVAEFEARALRPPLIRSELSAPDQVPAGPADPSSLNLWLVALLRAAGLNAHPALYARRDGVLLPPDSAVLPGVDGLLAVVEPPEGPPWVFDVASRSLFPAVPPDFVQGTRLVLAQRPGDGSTPWARVMNVPRSTPDASRTELRYTLRTGPRGRVQGRLEASCSGLEAQRIRQLLHEAPTTEWVKVMNEALRARGAPIPLDGVEVQNLEAWVEPLKFRGVVVPRPLLSESEDATPEVFFGASVLVGGEVSLPRETRRTDLLLRAPRVLDVRVRMELQEPWRIGLLPPPVDLSGPSAQLKVRMEPDAFGQLVLHRVWRSSRLSVPVEGWERHREFLRQVRLADDATISLVRDGSDLSSRAGDRAF